jgi:hypothetical protein
VNYRVDETPRDLPAAATAPYARAPGFTDQSIRPHLRVRTERPEFFDRLREAWQSWHILMYMP